MGGEFSGGTEGNVTLYSLSKPQSATVDAKYDHIHVYHHMILYILSLLSRACSGCIDVVVLVVIDGDVEDTVVEQEIVDILDQLYQVDLENIRRSGTHSEN